MGLTPLQIEDDEQENHISEDGLSDIRSPGTDEIVSPASQDGRVKVCSTIVTLVVLKISNKQQPNRLDTAVPTRTRADSDDAPQSVIHAPAHFKQFVRVVSCVVALPSR